MLSSLACWGPNVLPDQISSGIYTALQLNLAKLRGAGPIFSSLLAKGPHVPDQLLADLLCVLHHPLVVNLLARLRDVGILQSQVERFLFLIFVCLLIEVTSKETFKT